MLGERDAPARRRWLRPAGLTLAGVVAVTAGFVVFRDDAKPKVEVTAAGSPAGGRDLPPASPPDRTPPPTEPATTSTSAGNPSSGTTPTVTTHRVQAPAPSTTATTAKATTTTAAPTTTTTAPARDRRVPVDFAPRPDGTGGWLLRRDGSVTALGSAPPLGDAAGRIHDDAASRFHNEAVGIATSPSGAGYWIATARGEVFNFGDATARGSLADVVLASPIVDFSATHTSDGAQGYLMTDEHGNLYDFSAVGVPAQTGSAHPESVVAVAAAPSGAGHWLLQRDGKVSAAPDSLYVGGTPVNNGTWEAVDIAVTPSGAGYWVMTDNFGVFAFGDAQFQGSAGGVGRGPAVAIVANPAGDGYWQVTADGAVYGFGAPHWL
jgi:hypothetical protein